MIKSAKSKSLRSSQRNAARTRIALDTNVIIPKCDNPRRRNRLEKNDLKWLTYYFGPDCGLPREATFWYPFVNQQIEMIEAIGHVIRYGSDQGIFASRAEGKCGIMSCFVPTTPKFARP